MACLSYDASTKLHYSGRFTSTKPGGKSGAGGLSGYMHHVARSLDKADGIETGHSNNDIDDSLTENNLCFYKDENGEWQIAKHSKQMVDAVNRRTQYAIDHGARVQTGHNDTVVVRGVILQIGDLDTEKHPDWANDLLALAEDEFGEDNINAIAFHMDETSIHMHIPVNMVVDKGDSCSITQTHFFRSPKALAAQHKRMRKALIAKGYDIELENRPIEERAPRALTPDELKEIDRRKAEIKNKEVELSLRDKTVKKRENNVKIRENAVATQEEKLQQSLQDVQNLLERLQTALQDAQVDDKQLDDWMRKNKLKKGGKLISFKEAYLSDRQKDASDIMTQADSILKSHSHNQEEEIQPL